MALNKVEICGVNTAKLPILSNEEKTELFRRIKEGDPDARELYIKGNLRLVLSVIKRFSGSNENPDDLFPTIYRIDRIRSFKILEERFHVPYSGRFEEGEFRKRVQFMYGGKLEHIHFRYTGPSLEAVLDRLPTAKVTSEDDEGWTISAEVFGKGIEMWLRSQGESVSVIK